LGAVVKKVAFATFVFALLALPAVAADMPVKARVVDPPATVHDWSGLYAGVHVGGDWFKKDWFYPLTPTNVIAGGPFNVPSGSPTATSWLAGGQFGFNYQTGNWVVGGEIDFSWTNLNGSAADQFFPENGFSKTDFISTFAGRVGYAFDRVLLFAKAGGA